jgi:hypothetical protein
MNKTEKRKLINKTFLTWLNENYPEYEVYDEEGDGTFTLINNNHLNESMSYHRSYHEVCTYNWAPAEMIEHERIFNAYIETIIIPEVNRLEQLS